MFYGSLAAVASLASNQALESLKLWECEGLLLAPLAAAAGLMQLMLSFSTGNGEVFVLAHCLTRTVPK